MTTIDDIRAQFPQYQGVSDLDLLMGLHKTYYPQMHVKQFLGSIDGADMAYATAPKDAKMRDYYAQQVSTPMEGEAPEATAARIGGTMSGPVGDPGGRMGTAIRSGMQGLTFGAGDEIVAAGAAALDPNGTYDQYLQAERDRLTLGRDQYPGTALASELAGAVAVPVGAAGVAAQGARLPAAAARAGAVGGASGALYGFLSGEGGVGNRMESAATAGMIGAGAGAAVPLAGALAKRFMDILAERGAVRQAIKSAPSTEQLRAMGRQAYDAIDNAGVQISPDAVRGLGDDLVAGMKGAGLDTGNMSLTPQSARLADVIKEAVPEGSTGVPFRELEMIRRKAGIPASNIGNKVEGALGSQVIGGLDDFVNNIQPSQVVAGNADDLGANITKARDIWSRMSRSQMIEDAIDASENYLSGQSSGIRNQFSRILKNPKLSRGFSDVEKKAMRKVVNGSIPEQLLNLAGGGIGQIATIGGGAAIGGAGGPVGSTIGALMGAGAAAAARKGSEALSKRGAEGVRALIASGGIAQAPQSSPILRQLLERGLLGAVPTTSSAISGQFQPR